MNWFTGMFKRNQRGKKANKPEGVLREFVYLDEVSIYSLIASRLGAIKDNTIDTESTSQQNEMGGSAGVGFGATNASINIRVLENQTKGSQVVRKSIIQTTFKELYE